MSMYETKKRQIKEIIRFYGAEECRNILQSARNTLYSTRYNALKYLNLQIEEQP